MLSSASFLSDASTNKENETPEKFPFASPHRYELTVPLSRLVMTIPKKGFAETESHGGIDNPRYFYFEDRDGPILRLVRVCEPLRRRQECGMAIPRWVRTARATNVSFSNIGHGKLSSTIRLCRQARGTPTFARIGSRPTLD